MKYTEKYLFRVVIVAVALVSAPMHLLAQSEADMIRLVHDLAARLKSPPKVEQYDMPDFEAEMVESNEINAFALVGEHKIKINRGLVQVFYTAPGELAFVMAHEIGHLHNDVACHARAERLHLTGKALQRTCEDAADQIGMQYLLAAGYNPWDGAGAMGRFLMANLSQTSILGIFVGRFASDHPVSVDRIRTLAEVAKRACDSRPDICAQ